ncbi:aminoglycoside phosphotransferase family protein [Georgenia subflava]|uniref:Phosphotransferase n=1 Tax=Georgenia subflava TaxID=1622177 RepID=A0A6N7EKF6_9MICO|nr:aminoglycoside phosphotransferase family protein [Georgenia subflava]MPV35754.1 phosphotransferase [Georgenia subflava]
MSSPDVVQVPDAMRRELSPTADGPAWLARLPELVDRARTRWGLRLGEPFESGVAAWTAPARTRHGEDAVVKIVFPHAEAAHEATALALWSGRGGAELLDHDADAWTLLLRRHRPGHGLEEDRPLLEQRPEARLDVAAELLGRLHAAPVAELSQAVTALTTCATTAAELVRERSQRHGPALGADPGLLAAAAELWEELPATARSTVVVHGDLNPGNLVADDATGTRTWVAIDPKPMVGDPDFDPWPLLSQVAEPFRAESPVALLRGRTRVVCAAAGLDPGRVAAWAMARAAESALWRAAEQGDRTGALAELDQARIWSRLAV